VKKSKATGPRFYEKVTVPEAQPPISPALRLALSMTIAQVIQNRSNGCLNVAWSRAVADDVLAEIDKAFVIVRKES
jgi:hypothetical protein